MTRALSVSSRQVYPSRVLYSTCLPVGSTSRETSPSVCGGNVWEAWPLVESHCFKEPSAEMETTESVAAHATPQTESVCAVRVTNQTQPEVLKVVAAIYQSRTFRTIMCMKKCQTLLLAWLVHRKLYEYGRVCGSPLWPNMFEEFTDQYVRNTTRA